MQQGFEIAIIGGGAAGFLAAISCKMHHPGSRVYLYEKSDKLLAKVKISGGGRCNVTHACFVNSQLIKFYPRGEKFLKKAFAQFSTTDTVRWFENRNVRLKTEDDGRMFPVTDNSQTIIDCLLCETEKLGISIQLHKPIICIEKEINKFKLIFRDKIIYADKVVVACGGSPKIEGFDWIRKLGHTIESPVPSLFTFNMPHEPVKLLMGVSVDNITVRIPGTKLKTQGPLLITHWGMSGPAILKLSAWGARTLKDYNYQFTVQVNWLSSINEDDARKILTEEIRLHPKKKINNSNPFQLPNRLYVFLLSKTGINPEVILGEMGKKNQNKLINTLVNDEYKVEGKTTFKEEFVTCGGVSLNDVSMETMESKICRGLYFAGEVLDIDGITGGFNFQAAWTTGFIAGKLGSEDTVKGE